MDALIDDVDMSENVKKCINFDTIDEKFRGFGGVRIEDNLVVTKDGCMRAGRTFLEKLTKLKRS